ncbi:polysaccharide biosynthesis C-terminal domain-containing protein [Natrinema halophilum]|uniref:Polysaccharide biosynthesis C-terminal domain-containing protein n=1 Tax=Natrinema halophilum TaxID=1699371 RepID=A0A7D5KRY0_9EURY|nr:polysaccharide biosynthesis C-terminal domain-containing protein [Natrinema halophilum]QLG48904.1 polysaccharide biosynthesis C-terminal domain-containing protein [Natrinema halophilum]
MRIGQTSFVVFASKLVGSALGFVATLYFARTLGAAVLGHYALVLAVVAWLSLGGKLGISSAVVKRVSEGEEPSAHFTAGMVIIATLGLTLAIGILAVRNAVNEYIGAGVAPFVALLLVISLSSSLVKSGLNGERNVHISGLLMPVQTGFRSVVQIGLVLTGFGLGGMLIGHALGVFLAGLLGAAFLSVELARPRRRHFRSLFDFAKFSWLSGLKSRSFNDVDIVVLGALVPSALVGVYSVTWSIAAFLTLFDSAVSSTLFPELSRAEASANRDRIAGLITDSLTYGGLIVIPGLFGGVVLADRLLRLYGETFIQGRTVLWLLILASLVYGYQKQLMNALNALDRPDVAFRINVVFIATNAVLNVVLVLWIGWVGAAIATVSSACVGLALSYLSLRRLIDFTVPIGELSRQVTTAVVMAGFVAGGRHLLETLGVSHNALIVGTLTVFGAGVYFLALFAISHRFRSTVTANVPTWLPYSS